jgi:hypothetical protein
MKNIPPITQIYKGYPTHPFIGWVRRLGKNNEYLKHFENNFRKKNQQRHRVQQNIRF